MAKIPADLDLVDTCRRQRVVDLARRYGVSREAIYRRLRGRVVRPAAGVDRYEYERNLGTIIGLVRAGYRSGEDIAEILNVSRSMAYAWLRRAVEEGQLDRPAGKRGAIATNATGDYLIVVDSVGGALVPHRKK